MKEQDFTRTGFDATSGSLYMATMLVTGLGADIYDRVGDTIKGFVGRELISPVVRRMMKSSRPYGRRLR